MYVSYVKIYIWHQNYPFTSLTLRPFPKPFTTLAFRERRPKTEAESTAPFSSAIALLSSDQQTSNEPHMKYMKSNPIWLIKFLSSKVTCYWSPYKLKMALTWHSLYMTTTSIITNISRITHAMIHHMPLHLYPGSRWTVAPTKSWDLFHLQYFIGTQNLNTNSLKFNIPSRSLTVHP